MNKDNILAVADAIEKHSIPDLGFNMQQWVDSKGRYRDMSGHNCGTTACIAGWAAAVATGRTTAPKDVWDFGSEAEPAVRVAERFLGLHPLEQDRLFTGGSDFTTSAQAVAVLRHLAETGDVDWSIAKVEAA